MTKHRRQLGINNIELERIARDAEIEGKHEAAKLTRQQMTSYRHLPAQKRLVGSRKIRRYKNLGTFNRECSTSTAARWTDSGLSCQLTNIRRLVDGSGAATVTVMPYVNRANTKAGVWLLHFASYDVMKNHLQKRVEASPKLIKKLRRDPLMGTQKRRR